MDLNAIAVASMQRDTTKLGVIGQNVSNALTPGYKRQIAVHQPFAVQFDAGLASVEGGAAVFSDPTAAPMRHTGNMQDIALEGRAYLEVLDESGPRYTRQGALRLDVRGRLVGAGGLPVMGLQGEIILANLPFQVLPNGELRQDGRFVGQLKIVQFDRPAMLQAIGNGLYAQGRAELTTQPVTVTVRSGQLEQSNVNTAQEMVALTETVRHFEAMQRLLQGHDDSLEKTIRKLGEF